MSQQLSVPRPEIDSPADAPEPENPTPDAADAAPGERYREVVTGLLNDAQARQTMHLLVEVLVRSLAVVAYRSGPEGTGQLLRDMGESLRFFAEHRRSEREAEELKQNGIKPH